ncbi:hypothetical protein C1645_839235 [Glomus cerebriforme]|uniref:Uncharacterized protein n=1 Tax=Glomus cerebriforme TaxID=658196 RepID=A0A397SCN9_9GLOM|nr:hypothetical protein C1645_839235 [Glomus cerebriforme]
MAHQLNLIVGEIFKESDTYQHTLTKAVKIVSYFHSSTYFMGLLRDEQKIIYEVALKMLASKFAPERLKGPSTSRCGHMRQRHMPTPADKKFLPSDIIAIYPFDIQTFNQLDGNIVDYWDSAKGQTPELSRFALHLYGICVNSDSSNKVLGMSQLKSDILCKRKQAEIQKSKDHYKQDHIAIPIHDQLSDSENSDNETNIIIIKKWSHVIQNWIDMIREENYLNEDKPLEFTAVDRTIHPAEDPLAKWELNDIFNNRLESPYFVNALLSLDSNRN